MSLSSESLLNENTKEILSVIENDHTFKLKDMNNDNYKIWISQEHIFIQNFIKLFGLCLARSNSLTSIKTFSRAISFFKEELDNLEKNLIEFKLKPCSVEAKKETKEYNDFLNSLKDKEFNIIVPLVWFMLKLYSSVLEKNKVCNVANDLIKRWKSINFYELFEELKLEVDEILTKEKDPNYINNIKSYFQKVKELEINSWKMIVNQQ